jgi:hypothetical protein
MKQLLVYALIFTFIFPAYCFANPQETVSKEDDMMSEIMLILEDGIIDEDEAEWLGGFMGEQVIYPSADAGACGWSLVGFLMMLLCFPGTLNPPSYCLNLFPTDLVQYLYYLVVAWVGFYNVCFGP